MILQICKIRKSLYKYDNERQITQEDQDHQVTENQDMKITKSQKIEKNLSTDVSLWLLFQDFQMYTLP